MQIGIVGLGLMGGSAARAYKLAGHTVLAYDRDKLMLEYAILCGAVDDVLLPERMAACDAVILALYPKAAAAFLEEHAAQLGENTLVIDFCGTKKGICEKGFSLAKAHGFVFVGGHPMAGTHLSGFKHSRADLFKGATMVIVPPSFDDIALFDRVKASLLPLGFGAMSVTSAAAHDKRIAFTSQLAHLVSNAYVKSPTARDHKGHSAGSYRDLTRVAHLQPDMWTELFLENREPLLEELDSLMENLAAYREALSREDAGALWQLLEDGRRIKGEIDG